MPKSTSGAAVSGQCRHRGGSDFAGRQRLRVEEHRELRSQFCRRALVDCGEHHRQVGAVLARLDQHGFRHHDAVVGFAVETLEFGHQRPERCIVRVEGGQHGRGIAGRDLCDRFLGCHVFALEIMIAGKPVGDDQPPCRIERVAHGARRQRDLETRGSIDIRFVTGRRAVQPRSLAAPVRISRRREHLDCRLGAAIRPQFAIQPKQFRICAVVCRQRLGDLRFRHDGNIGKGDRRPWHRISASVEGFLRHAGCCCFGGIEQQFNDVSACWRSFADRRCGRNLQAGKVDPHQPVNLVGVILGSADLCDRRRRLTHLLLSDGVFPALAFLDEAGEKRLENVLRARSGAVRLFSQRVGRANKHTTQQKRRDQRVTQ